MDIAKLKQRREKLMSAVKQIDARISKLEREQREAEQRELVRLIQSRGITPAQLSQILDSVGKGDAA